MVRIINNYALTKGLELKACGAFQLEEVVAPSGDGLFP